MSRFIEPFTDWDMPGLRLPSLFENGWAAIATIPNGLSVSEDDKNVYVEAAMPGLKSEDVEVSFKNGTLWIRGEKQEEEKKKKFYRKATREFSYRVSVPGEIDEKREPDAGCKDGVCRVTFKKTAVTAPKKIKVK